MLDPRRVQRRTVSVLSAAQLLSGVGGGASLSVGSLLIILATVNGAFPVLLLGSALLGLGTAANLQARFAAVDFADAEHRGRSLAIVVWSVSIGAVAGPNLIGPGAVVGEALGLPALAGPFVFSTAGLALAALPLLPSRCWSACGRTRCCWLPGSVPPEPPRPRREARQSDPGTRSATGRGRPEPRRGPVWP